ncbi:hypothetical protein O6H91_09G042300 [Diphasiastrum complanatum]|uniref:Uncharacterized protein n=1 Tax=Diphasiastrum complanatum TaxID=34168 RepID=A0ACC2CNI9_DIPCM|nr:hypothetical protein O6H91_09G042300 [Diphasiastrum complanatum]
MDNAGLRIPLIRTESTAVEIEKTEDTSSTRGLHCKENLNGGEARKADDTDESLILVPNELAQFQSHLFWMGLDQSTIVNYVCSWVLFFLFSVIVPAVNSCFVACPDCDDSHSHPFERLVDYSDSALGAVAFICLSYNFRTYGLSNLLLLSNILEDSPEVQHGYREELHGAFRLLAIIILPCFVLELSHKIWWFSYVSVEVPAVTSHTLKTIVMCSIVMIAWLYKTNVFLFMCSLFRLTCSLQILRLQGYNKLVGETPEVSVILSGHMHICDQLLIISHRSRTFLMTSLLTITLSQFLSLFAITTTAGPVNFFRAGDLAICSTIQLTGISICLYGAAKITHRAQRIVSIVSQWHAVTSCTPSLASAHVPVDNASAKISTIPAIPCSGSASSEKSQHELEALSADYYYTEQMPLIYNFESFQKRQALVSYLQHNKAGISTYGFVLDRAFIFTILGIEFSLVLFILGMTIGIH